MSDMKTILILDDERSVRQSFADYFEDQQWHVVQAQSAEEALMLIQVDQPDAAIVDVRLPGMDGNEFIRQINQMGINMACAICTGSPDFQITPELQAIYWTSDKLFKKPVTDLTQLENELLRLMKNITQETGAG